MHIQTHLTVCSAIPAEEMACSLPSLILAAASTPSRASVSSARNGDGDDDGDDDDDDDGDPVLLIARFLQPSLWLCCIAEGERPTLRVAVRRSSPSLSHDNQGYYIRTILADERIG